MIYADVYPSHIISNVVYPIWIYLAQFFILKIVYIFHLYAQIVHSDQDAQFLLWFSYSLVNCNQACEAYPQLLNDLLYAPYSGVLWLNFEDFYKSRVKEILDPHDLLVQQVFQDQTKA